MSSYVNIHEEPVPLSAHVRERLHGHEQPVEQVRPHREAEEGHICQRLASGQEEEHTHSRSNSS
jgi:hypothetical protein